LKNTISSNNKYLSSSINQPPLDDASFLPSKHKLAYSLFSRCSLVSILLLLLEDFSSFLESTFLLSVLLDSADFLALSDTPLYAASVITKIIPAIASTSQPIPTIIAAFDKPDLRSRRARIPIIIPTGPSNIDVISATSPNLSSSSLLFGAGVNVGAALVSAGGVTEVGGSVVGAAEVSGGVEVVSGLSTLPIKGFLFSSGVLFESCGSMLLSLFNIIITSLSKYLHSVKYCGIIK
jgi:hypothetical protein